MPINFPNSPYLNQEYTSGSKTWYWTGTTWKSRSTFIGVKSTYSSTPPSFPSIGDIWIDSSDGTKLTYINDGDSNQWAELSSTGLTVLLPSQTGNSGKYLTTDGSSSSWTTVSQVPSQSGNNGKYLTTDGTTSSWGTVSSYSAPTLGSTLISSGATVTTINGLSNIKSNAHTSLDSDGYEVDIALMQLMGAY
jgi:hypothetical protein